MTWGQRSHQNAWSKTSSVHPDYERNAQKTDQWTDQWTDQTKIVGTSRVLRIRGQLSTRVWPEAKEVIKMQDQKQVLYIQTTNGQ